ANSTIRRRARVQVRDQTEKSVVVVAPRKTRRTLYRAGNRGGHAREAISLSAVYRNLSDLEAEGQVRRSARGGEREIRYQFMAAERCQGCLHLCCTRCGRTFHMDSAGAAALSEVVEKTEHFTLNRAETVLYGLCGACRKGDTT
ncbi:MAG: transcriptional repressor, partial [Oscillibacter sp.]|nr:transcriptional repressor [Oscillibacter sp.]